jgi:hypothetical protein
LSVYNNTFNDIKAKYDSTIGSINAKSSQIKELYAKILSLCIQASSNLQKESLPVILAIRKELNLAINNDEYLSMMNKVFKVHSSFITPDNIKKMIQPDN